VLQLLWAVQRAADQPESPDAAKGLYSYLHLHSIRCYCAKVLAIVALRMQDCTFELGLETFQAYNHELDSLPGWEFNLIEEVASREAAEIERRYRISRVHMRLIAALHPHGVQDLQGVLEVRLVPSRNLQMVITGLPEYSLRGRVELVSGHGPGEVLFETGELKINRCELKEYEILERGFQESLKSPERAKELLNAASARFGSPNYPVDEIIETIFDDLPEDSAQAKAEIVRRLTSNLHRLYDGPTVADKIRAGLNDTLWAKSFIEGRHNYPLEVQADLADLRMSLQKLERADSFEGAFAISRQ
jgi:hypothetical protein